MQLDADAAKRFYLQYFFPPSCVGETGRVGGVSRRELGHGSLAERGLAPTIPSEVRSSPIYVNLGVDIFTFIPKVLIRCVHYI